MEIIALPGFSEPFSSITHLLAAGTAALGAYVLYTKGKKNMLRLSSLFLFSFSLIFLFSMSGVYHLLEPGGAPRNVLMHLDHSAIWVLIAGTFTPIHIILFRGFWRWGFLAMVWSVAITGLVLKIVFFTEIPEWLGLTFYLGLGWLGLVSGYKLKTKFGNDEFHWLWLGGLAYSIGAVLEFLRWPILINGVVGPHEIFHIFVILGALFHWILVYKWATHPITDTMTFHVKVFPDNKYIANSENDTLTVKASSIEDLKDKIKETVKIKYHKTISPKIHLKYFKEETIN